MIREMELYGEQFRDETFETIYFGGGTPSVLTLEEVSGMMEALHRIFRVSPLEITFEANPEDLTGPYLEGLRSLGITRLSLGVQTFNNELLKSINRNHDRDTAITAFNQSRRLGFENINLDLIYALPGSSSGILHEDLKMMKQLNPEHISLYAYTIEPKTVFENWIRKGKVKKIDEEAEADSFERIMEYLDSHGFEQYEISNFAQNEAYSLHNKSYWDLTPYLGIGPSAHSFYRNERWYNPSHNRKYIDSISAGELPAHREERSPTSTANEYIFTSLRTKWGCALGEMNTRFEVDLLKFRKTEILHLQDAGMIQLENQVITITPKGKLLADEIASRLMLDDEF